MVVKLMSMLEPEYVERYRRYQTIIEQVFVYNCVSWIAVLVSYGEYRGELYNTI